MTSDPAPLYAAHLATMQLRAETALERGGFEHLVIPSGTVHYQLFDDRDYPYAVNPHFKAWVPLTRNPGSWLVVTPGRRPRLVYLQPFDYWHVVPEAPSGYWPEHFDLVVIRQPEEASRHLPPDAARCAILGEAQSALGRYGAFKPNNPQPVLDYLDYHRGFKTSYEIEMLRQATQRGVRGHRAAERAFRAGASEFGIHLAYCQAVGQDSTELPYNNIVALNAHGAVLHYTERDRLPPRPVHSFLIDAGASFGGYACDITRTYAADAGSEFQQLIDAVDAVQQRLSAGFVAGRDYRDLHLQAHLELAGVLRDSGVLRISAESAVESGVSAKFFPHGLGHGIGLQVHDVAGFAESDRGGSIAPPDGHPHLRLTRKLEPGMVVTNEPGVYFAELLLEELRGGPHANDVDWERIDAFRPCGGIRIEDDIVVTDADPVNLTREAFAG
ncbi:Xaa-Pro dipeptidase [Luteimonas sp. RD2P54]|uniref:Xaa-Pro dipeptidase n=1 Tax=Luteimonas endophytica TaxID=3042023 RepID=A0ABT6J7W7_9GAMM|nr:Xaa-Pro dipeptidase [Luteimonas endophytica]MDH5822915.1 Xaa-Pro dipeptidase [Luteimonas endophytica]